MIKYLLNKAPTKSLEAKSPYEDWTRKKPQLDHLWIIGCAIHIKTFGGGLKEFDDQFRPMIINEYGNISNVVEPMIHSQTIFFFF